MAQCECLAGCPFFNDKMANMPSVSDMLKQQYCLDDFAGCARYKVFKVKGKGNVPADLYPNDISRAMSLTAG
jgi:hypothetical protein